MTAGRKRTVHWIDIPGDPQQHYMPRMQWISEELLLIQQLNRKQNHLIIWKYNIKTSIVKKLYEEKEKTWVDISYPDITADGWDMNDLRMVDDGTAFLRLSETDGWRHIYKITVRSGEKRLLTPGSYDVATIYGHDGKYVYFSASPRTSTERYLYRTALDGDGKTIRITPEHFTGVNHYDFAPNAKYAFHRHSSIHDVPTTHLIEVAGHKRLKTYVNNVVYKEKVARLQLPKESFFTVTTEDGISVDGKMTKPLNFDPSKKYPVLFYVYGEPWGYVANNVWSGLWSKMLAQQGCFIIAMDNRGTPCLKGSAWRKSIYRKVDVINARDQAMAAKEVLKWPYRKYHSKTTKQPAPHVCYTNHACFTTLHNAPKIDTNSNPNRV